MPELAWSNLDRTFWNNSHVPRNPVPSDYHQPTSLKMHINRKRQKKMNEWAGEGGGVEVCESAGGKFFSKQTLKIDSRLITCIKRDSDYVKIMYKYNLVYFLIIF